jgi:hypothetical protein
MGGQAVQHHVDVQLAWHGLVDLFEERHDINGFVSVAQVGVDLTGRDVQRGKQVLGAVAFVVACHRLAATTRERQRWLGAVKCLHLGLFIEAEHHGPLRWVQVQADDVDALDREPVAPPPDAVW